MLNHVEICCNIILGIIREHVGTMRNWNHMRIMREPCKYMWKRCEIMWEAGNPHGPRGNYHRPCGDHQEPCRDHQEPCADHVGPYLRQIRDHVNTGVNKHSTGPHRASQGPPWTHQTPQQSPNPSEPSTAGFLNLFLCRDPLTNCLKLGNHAIPGPHRTKPQRASNITLCTHTKIYIT